MGQSASTRAGDTIHINELLLALSIPNDDADASKARPQAVLLSLVITHDASNTARSANLTHSIDYAAVYRTLVEHLPNARYASLEALLDHVFDTVFSSHPEINEASVAAALRDTSPRFAIEATRRRGQMPPTGQYRFIMSRLAISTIVSLNPRERTEKQPVVVDIVVQRQQRTNLQERFPFFGLSTSVRQMFAPSEYLTIEALASAIARHVLEYTKDTDGKVTVQVSKPNALPLAASAQVQVTRQRADFADVPSPGVPPPVLEETASANGGSSSSHSVALALGSNLGDRFANIETALRLLESPTLFLSDPPKDAEVSVVDTSFMYETAPMCITDQPQFANCACMIETNLLPMELHRLVMAIETALGTLPSGRHGPRAVDLDILMYDDQLVDTRPLDGRVGLDNLIGELVIPHPYMCEREFVLRPLNDIIPHFVHPVRNKTIRTLLDEMISTRSENDGLMFRVMPFPKYPSDGTELVNIHGVQVPATAKYWIVSPIYPTKHGRPPETHIMAILNVTPDSFSDGVQHNAVPAVIAYTTSAVASGADIIDIGGYTTRPGSSSVPAEEESRRVIPVIRAIREHPDHNVRHSLLSVDTSHWKVAAEAIRVGANCINDVCAFMGPTYPPEDASAKHRAKMRSVARELSVPVILAHSRGEAGENQDYSAYPGGLIPAIQTELGRKVDAIVRGPGGVRRWLVFVDPGIGFSKPVEGQLALMRDLSRVTAEDEPGNVLAGYPLLFGVPKKSMLGRQTAAQEKGWAAAAAAVACAVQQGASVVRVHDVVEMRTVVATASAIWSGGACP